MRSKVEEIREKYADASWPRLAYFVHGEAKLDIAALLVEYDRLRIALTDIWTLDQRADGKLAYLARCQKIAGDALSN